ncbi:MAG: Cof-type HAD-IIB family hydrolase [Treponema sp.]|jgi:hydroxymethylpyrimidine pyrophosphatase-like HAD family hydrolase|nr:Cof-type HAD-IIB family hydrolase [Treponema sp.]
MNGKNPRISPGTAITEQSRIPRKPSAVFIDIDGTLVSGNLEGPFPDDIAGIEKARRAGHRFFLCTGRGFGHIPGGLRKAPYFDGIVAGGGVHVLLGGKVLYRKSVSVEALCNISALFLENGKRCTFQGEKATYCINRSDYVEITGKDDFARKYPGAHIAMMTVDKTITEKTRAFLETVFDIYPQIPHYDCFIKGESKSRGMRAVLDELALGRENSVAIGDSANDLDMIRFAGAGIAVGNACDELKAAADWISAPCGKGGVVRALEHLGLC